VSGLFVAFEGGEGAGKSTQVAAVRRALRAKGLPVTATREPGGTELGVRLREMILSGKDLVPRAETLLYLADRAQHVDTVIRPALERGDVVLCDRYVDSTFAYQGAGRGLSLEAVVWWAADHLVPKLTVLLDVDPMIGLDRAGRRGDMDRFEAEEAEFHQRVRTTFLHCAQQYRYRYLVVDARREAEALTEGIVRAIVDLLPAEA
jgi:dTMP kinase